MHDLDPSARDLEGYLFPETYALSRRAGAPELVRMMVARFREVFTPDLQAAAGRARAVDRAQAVTLASLVEKETAKPEERPTVAASTCGGWRSGWRCSATRPSSTRSSGRTGTTAT